jgi:DNA processing protein
MHHFNYDPRAILMADEAALRAVPGVGPKIAQSIREIDIGSVERALSRWQQTGIRVITFHDPEYPPKLRALEDCPPTLFVRGQSWSPIERSVALVGRRHPSEDARKIAQNLSSHLADNGYVIVSGLAYGIDAAAHMGALAVPGGCTLAVVGSGVLSIYPPDHDTLAKAVMRQGALVSELHPSRSVSASNLVARNRIITGLSDCVIVVESEADGGAMYAARFALAQGRQLYVVDSATSGNQLLIEAGAKIIRPDLRELPFD